MIIRTVFRGPTDRLPARIIASAVGFATVSRVVHEYCHALNPEDNHARAAMRLADGLDIAGEWASGEHANGYAFVRVFPSDHRYRSEGGAGERRRLRDALAALDPIRFGGGAQ